MPIYNIISKLQIFLPQKIVQVDLRKAQAKTFKLLTFRQAKLASPCQEGTKEILSHRNE